MRIAYADPPYLGCCRLYGHHHPDGLCWDSPETHEALMARVHAEYPDGWAISLHTPSWEEYAHIARKVVGPNVVRPAAWVKPFAAFKPNVNPAYAWEPVVFYGGRKGRSRSEATVRDWHSASITLKRGLTGAKPEGFCFWLFDLMGLQRGDEFVDMFPGSGAVTKAWESYQRQARLA